MSGARRKARPATGPDVADYAVGYRRPPVHTQFRKGQSGNPKGRPKGARGVATLLEETLSETITVTERGQPRRMRKGEAMIAALVAKALRGDVRAAALVFRQIAGERAAQTPEPARRPEEELSDAELAQMIEMLREIASQQEAADAKE